MRPRAPGVWHVVTRANSPGYTVRRIEEEDDRPGAGLTWQCDCPDYAKNGLGMCKHTEAVELTQAARDPGPGDT